MADVSSPTRNHKPIGMPSEEGDNHTKPLLSQETNSPKAASFKLSAAVIFVSILLIAGIAISAVSAFASKTSLLSSSSKEDSLASPLRKLQKPVVLMLSSDGFRFGYQFKTATPNIHRLIATGTEAETGLIPVFPTMTFPNHYSIATGLYPAYHGIIMNSFVDPKTGKKFTTASREPEWWLGEPLWATVVNQGLKAATFFWPGSEVHKGAWDCPEGFCHKFNSSIPFETRVDTILSYFDLPSDQIPDLMTMYFDEPDHQGHSYGPDDPRITKAVGRIDATIGRLINGLEKRGVFEDVTIILVGDHGMVGTCDKKMISLDDLPDEAKIPSDWVQAYSPVLAIRPRWGNDVATKVAASKNKQLVKKINEALSSGKVENGEYLKVYLKKNLPKRLHYSKSYRIPPIIGMLAEGFTVNQTRTGAQQCKGSHGYDNAFFSMRTIFIGHGPQFARGKKVESFENVQIYNVVSKILNLHEAPNNGSLSFPGTILLPRP